jgi:hypothetical protein
LAALSANADTAVGGLSHSWPLVDGAAPYRWPYGFSVPGADDNDKVRFLTIHNELKASPLQERLLDILAGGGIGVRLIDRFPGIAVNHNPHGAGM